MNHIRTLVEAVADRIHASGDAQARAYGLTVERLPWGKRRVYDRRVAVWLEQRRRRILRTGGDRIDRALAATDPGTRQALAATGARMTTEQRAAATRAGRAGAGRAKFRRAA